MATRPQVSKTQPIRTSIRKNLYRASVACARLSVIVDERKKRVRSEKSTRAAIKGESKKRIPIPQSVFRAFFSIRRPDYLLVSWRLEAWNRLLYSMFNAQYPDGVQTMAKFAKNSHCSYKKNLAVKSLCIIIKEKFSH